MLPGHRRLIARSYTHQRTPGRLVADRHHPNIRSPAPDRWAAGAEFTPWCDHQLVSAQHAGDPAAFAADVLDEGPAEPEYEPGVASRRPTKTSAGGALIRDSTGRVLFVVPTYKAVLDIPGGMTE